MSLDCVVEDDQLSLAIGKKGQNVRLASALIGMKIEIKGESEVKGEVAQALSRMLRGLAPPADGGRRDPGHRREDGRAAGRGRHHDARRPAREVRRRAGGAARASARSRPRRSWRPPARPRRAWCRRRGGGRRRGPTEAEAPGRDPRRDGRQGVDRAAWERSESKSSPPRWGFGARKSCSCCSRSASTSSRRRPPWTSPPCWRSSRARRTLPSS